MVSPSYCRSDSPEREDSLESVSASLKGGRPGHFPWNSLGPVEVFTAAVRVTGFRTSVGGGEEYSDSDGGGDGSLGCLWLLVEVRAPMREGEKNPSGNSRRLGGEGEVSCGLLLRLAGDGDGALDTFLRLEGDGDVALDTFLRLEGASLWRVSCLSGLPSEPSLSSGCSLRGCG